MIDADLDAWWMTASVLTAALGCGFVLMMSVRLRTLDRAGRVDETKDVTVCDAKTSLPTRLAFQRRLTQSAARCDGAACSMAVMLVEIDGLAPTTHAWTGADTHDIQSAAASLSASAAPGDTVAFAGGPQFLVLVRSFSAIGQVADTACRAASALRANCAPPASRWLRGGLT